MDEWIEIVPPVKATMPVDAVKVQRTQLKFGCILAISIGSDVQDTMQWRGGGRVRIEVSKDLTRLRLVETAQGGVEIKQRKGYIRVSIAATPKLRGKSIAPTVCKHEALAPSPRAGSGILALTLPPSFNAK